MEPRRFIGSNIYMRGVHELPVCEALWRLAEPGTQVADIGANIGVMTSVLSLRVGRAGKLTAFEAHPAVYHNLKQNIQRWPRRSIVIEHKAVSSSSGYVWICEGAGFAGNEGTARVGENGSASVRIASVKLDESAIGPECRLAKIDVEGHESHVLAGAERLLSSGKLRDIVLETTHSYPGPAHTLLHSYGYAIFELSAKVSGPRLTIPCPRQDYSQRVCDYVATLDANRALGLLRPRGWKLLKPSRDSASMVRNFSSSSQ